MSKFSGNLKTLSHLPKDVKKLYIAISTSDQAKQITKELPELVERNRVRQLGMYSYM